jgi:hypothetical protein
MSEERKYQLGSPNGWRGDTFTAASDEEAVAKAEAAPYFEHVLDLMDWQDEQGQPVVLLVVGDEERREEYTCPKHGPTTVVRKFGYTGYAGGRCYGVELACGCTDVDESGDINAAC